MDPKSQPFKSTFDSDKAKKKSGRPGKIFKVALLMLRRRSKKSKAPVDMCSDKNMWQRMLGSMRPLHIQGSESPPTAVGVDIMSLAPLKPNEDFETSPMSLPSLSPSSSSLSFSRASRTSRSSSFSHASRISSSSSFGTSQYASATNLQELDNNSNGDDDEENAFKDDNNKGDEMIDAKAEKFIAQFYEQMRRQRQND